MFVGAENFFHLRDGAAENFEAFFGEGFVWGEVDLHLFEEARHFEFFLGGHRDLGFEVVEDHLCRRAADRRRSDDARFFWRCETPSHHACGEDQRQHADDSDDLGGRVHQLQNGFGFSAEQRFEWIGGGLTAMQCDGDN